VSTATICDNCGCDVRMAQYPLHVERQGDPPLRFSEPAGGWDFCSKRCIAAWARPTTQTPAPAPDSP